MVEVDGERIRAVRPDVPAPPAGAVRLPGLTLPGFANAHSHAFHRALRGRTHGGRGSFWTWRRQMYDGRRGARSRRLLPARPSDVRGDGAGRHHGGRRVPLPAPRARRRPVRRAERDGRRARRRGARGGHPDHAARHVLPPRRTRCGELDPVQRRFSDGSADAWAERAAALPPDAGVRVGAAVHSVRAVDPASIATVAAWAGERRVPLHAHVSEQPGRERAGASPPTARRRWSVLAAAGALDGRFTAVHADPLYARRHPAARRRRLLVLHLPDDRARPRRRHRTDVRAARRRRPPDARQRLARRHRPARGGARRRAGRAPGVARSAAATTPRRCCAWRPSTATPRSAGRTPGASRPARSPTSPRSAWTPCARPGTRPGDALAGAVFAATAADVRHVVVGGRVIVPDGQHTALDVSRELAAVLA